MKLNTNQILIAGLILIVLLLATCTTCQRTKINDLKKDCGKVITKVERDTIYKTDSFTSTSYIPQPYAVERTVTKEIQLPGKEVLVLAPIDSAAILKDYLSSYYYKDRLQTEYGFIDVSDTISKNRTAGRSWKANFSIPVVKETITVQEKKRNSVWVGLIAQGNNATYLQSGGVSLMLQNKRNTAFEVGALTDLSGNLNYQAGIKFKLSLKK
jgi:hypothetical protein